MTKSEVLKLNDPSAIWEEMQKNPILKADGDVWLHVTRLTVKINRERSQQMYGDPETYLYMDPLKKN